MNRSIHVLYLLIHRELLSGLMTKTMVGFALLCLGAGLLIPLSVPTPDTIPYLLLQMTMFLVTLIATVFGLMAVHDVSEEETWLFSQPVPVESVILAKFVSRFLVLFALTSVLFIPSLLTPGINRFPVLILYGCAIGLSAVFTAMGIGVGYLMGGRIQSFLGALTTWVLFIVGIDVLAVISSGWDLVQRFPVLWVSWLLISPIDTVRLTVLNHLEEFLATGALEEEWLVVLFTYLDGIFVINTLFWTSLFLVLGWVFCYRTER